MKKEKYTEKEISWAIEKLKEKHPEKANREQAIKFLDSMQELTSIVVDQVDKDEKSGKLKQKLPN